MSAEGSSIGWTLLAGICPSSDRVPESVCTFRDQALFLLCMSSAGQERAKISLVGLLPHSPRSGGQPIATGGVERWGTAPVDLAVFQGLLDNPRKPVSGSF